MEHNPYSSPADVEAADGTAGGKPLWKRAVVFAYLVVFCLLHGVSFYQIVLTIREQGRLSVLLIVSSVIPVLAAVCVWRYAVDGQPKRNLRFWQAVPFLVFMYALMSFRVAFEEAGGSLVAAEFVAAVVVGLFLYGPAIYMSYRLTGALAYWETQSASGQAPTNREPPQPRASSERLD